MTRDRRFKRAVRKRMEATGQNYSSALASLLPHESAGGGEEAEAMPASTQGTRDVGHDVIQQSEGEPLKAYLAEIGKIPQLSNDEAMQLAGEKEAGEQAEWYRTDRSGLSAAQIKKLDNNVENGRAARKRLTEGNLRLVVSIARRYQRLGYGVGLMELIEEGNRGLVRAVDKFDGTPWPEGRRMGTSFGSFFGDASRKDIDSTSHGFSSLATYWIRAALIRAIDVGQLARIPRDGEGRSSSDGRKLRAVLEDLPAKLGREPTVAEVANELGPFTPERATSYALSMIAKLDCDPSQSVNERAERQSQVRKQMQQSNDS